MFFSIVIPAHNGERFLHYTLASAVNQKRKANEVLVIDDASTDNTAAIALSAKWKDYVKYFYRNKSAGFVDAWNRSIKFSTGNFITILHQDDLLHPEYLFQVEKAIRRYPKARHIYAACDYINEKGRVIKIPPEPHSLEPVLYSGKQYAHNYLNGIITNNHIHRCPGVTTSRELLLNECTYRKEAGQIADDDFFLRVGAYTDVVGISQPLASFRHHADSTTGRIDSLSLELAEAYLFQARYYNENITILESKDVHSIGKQSINFINRLLFHSLIFDRKEWRERALQLRLELDQILPEFFAKNIPLWAQIMWFLTPFDQGSSFPVVLYVRILHNVIKLRNTVRSLLRQS